MITIYALRENIMREYLMTSLTVNKSLSPCDIQDEKLKSIGIERKFGLTI